MTSILLLALLCPTADPDPRLAGYRVAPGFKVAIAATEPMVINPVSMTFGDDGRLFVIEWVSGDGLNDHIKVLTDTDGDGVFDKSAIYMDGLELPAGLLFWDGWTYISLGQEVVRFRDKDGDGKLETREAIASGFGNDNSHHRVSGLTMGPDGWIYITTGDSDAHARGSDGSTATVLRCGGVFRCKPDGSRMDNVAFGMRNPFGNVAFDDEFRIFHTDNDNEGSVGFTGCRILHVVEGGDYGWRLREGARCCQPDYDRATWNGGRPGRLGHVAETGRGAPAGLCVLNSAAFPPSTRNLLVYPDVFRKTVRAYKLKPSGATYTVADEFELLASDEGLFRPDDAEIGPDGALYILDWRTDSGGAGAPLRQREVREDLSADVGRDRLGARTSELRAGAIRLAPQCRGHDTLLQPQFDRCSGPSEIQSRDPSSTSREAGPGSTHARTLRHGSGYLIIR